MPSPSAVARHLFDRDPSLKTLRRIATLGYFTGGEFTPLSFTKWARLAVRLKRWPTRREKVREYKRVTTSGPRRRQRR